MAPIALSGATGKVYSMVLEETVVFENTADADVFIAFLRKRGCASRKTVSSEVALEEVYCGTLDQLISWQTRAAEECEADGHMQDAAWFRSGAEKYTQVRDRITVLIAGKGPGDLLYTYRDMEEEFSAMIPRATEILSRAQTGRPVLDECPLLVVSYIMSESGHIEKTPEGYRLVKTPVPGEVRAELAGNIPEVSEDLFEELTTRVNYTLYPEVRVTIEPSVYFLCEPEELLDILMDLSIDDESLDIIESDLYAKKLIITSLVDVVEQAGTITLTDLTRTLREYHSKAEATRNISLALSENITAMVVADLKKLEILGGKDPVVRINKKLQNRMKKGP